VSLSFLFPTELSLEVEQATNNAPQGLVEILQGLLFKIVENPVQALMTGNYIGILAWAIGLGLVLRGGSATTKQTMQDLSDAVTVDRAFCIWPPSGIVSVQHADCRPGS